MYRLNLECGNSVTAFLFSLDSGQAVKSTPAICFVQKFLSLTIYNLRVLTRKNIAMLKPTLQNKSSEPISSKKAVTELQHSKFYVYISFLKKLRRSKIYFVG